MALSNAQSYNEATLDQSMNMDIDMDIDLGIDTDIPFDEAEAMNFDLQDDHNDTNGLQSGPIADDTSQISNIEGVNFEKIHIRGLDEMTTEDVEALTEEHFGGKHSRVEWIDDTSANIIYQTTEEAVRAMNALILQPDLDLTRDPLQLRPLKKLSKSPQFELQARFATATDTKKPRAREASKFYLWHPEHDPAERRREGKDNRRNPGKNKRRRDEDETPFDVNMYDDDPQSLAARNRPLAPRNGFNSDDGQRTKRHRAESRRGELFTRSNNRSADGRLRNRSTSPSGDGDGRMGFGEDELQQKPSRQRDITPPLRTNTPRPKGNNGKELFHSKGSFESRLQPPTIADSKRELFSGRSALQKDPASRELFPHHRRTDAIDASDTTADLFADRMTSAQARALDDQSSKGRSLSDRITGISNDLEDRITPKSSSTEARHSRTNSELSIRGAAQQNMGSGFAIRGQAAGTSSRVKELFPDREETVGREGEPLENRIKGRAMHRKRAQDLFQ